MKRSILVTGGDTYLGALLVRQLAEGGHRVLSTIQQPQEKSRAGSDPLQVPWLKSSALSARNVLMEALEKLTTIDTIFLIVSPVSLQPELSFTAPIDLERQWDDWARGIPLLTREIQRQFVGNTVDLRFVFYLEENANLHPVTVQVYEGLAAFVRALMRTSSRTPTKVSAFECRNGDGGGFAGMLAKTEQPQMGDWTIFPEKSSLFGKNQRRSIA